MATELSWKIAGPAGYGIMTTGLVFAKTLSRGGWNVFCYPEYPSLIKGGHNTYQVRASEKEVLGPVLRTDILVALDEKSVSVHAEEMAEESVVIHDDSFSPKSEKRLLPVPLEELAGKEIMRNSVALGVTVALLNYDLSLAEIALSDAYRDKGEKVVKANVEALRRGHDFAKEESFHIDLARRESEKRMVLTGNDALSMGAIKAGMKFYAAYPMTPASSILHYMASHAREKSLVVKHTEDELAAINMVLGASYAGARAMVATSGGGFALMTEALGNAGISELPLVLAEVQRPGPSTGMPTWTSQADLKFVVNASQGEFPRIVLAPGDTKDAFHLAFDAFNLADRFQVPVIVMSDKHLAESAKSELFFDTSQHVVDRGKVVEGDVPEGLKRYAFTDDSVSPRWFPGQKGGMFKATSYEHDEEGFTTEDAFQCARMYVKRLKKFDSIKLAMPEPRVFGPENAETTVVGWGSTKGAILEALELLGGEVSFTQITHLFPMTEKIAHALEGKKVVDVECNASAQLAGMMEEYLDFKVDAKVLKFDGRPFFPSKLAEKIKEVV